MTVRKKILMMKEPLADGSFRYYRIPWDIIICGETHGLSPVGVLSTYDDGRVASAEYAADISNDLLKLEATDVESEVEEMLWFDSEQALMSIFENVTMYYDTDSSQSIEAGYPRT